MLVGTAGCSDQEFTRRVETDSFLQAPSNLVDILWIIDDSHSMAEEQAAVSVNAEAFVGGLEGSGMDFHLGLVTTDMDVSNPQAGVLLGNPPYLENSTPDYVSAFQERVLVSTGGSDQEKGLQAALSALSPPLVDTRNVGFFRPEAMLAIVVVSDENDCTDFGALGANSRGQDCYTHSDELVPVGEIAGLIRGLKDEPGMISFSGIVGPREAIACEDTVYGHRYEIAVASFGGVLADICQDEYGLAMQELGLVASGILDTFNLSLVPYADSIEVRVAHEAEAEFLVPESGVDGWTYIDDPAAPRIQFHGEAVPPRGARIAVHYEVAGSVTGG